MGQLVITSPQYNKAHIYLFSRLLWQSKRGEEHLTFVCNIYQVLSYITYSISLWQMIWGVITLPPFFNTDKGTKKLGDLPKVTQINKVAERELF